MVELVYVGAPGVSFVDPPLGQLEPDARVHVEDDQVERLLRSGSFERVPTPKAAAKPKSTTQPEPAQEV
jgi:hypothetical protein